MRAARIRADLLWFCGIDVVLCIIMIALGPLGAAGFPGPILGLMSATLYDWRLAAVHVLCAAANVALRAVIVPMSTDNFLLGTGAVALGLSSLHLAVLGVRWLQLLWYHGAIVKPRGRAGTSEQLHPAVQRSATRHPAAHLARSQRTCSAATQLGVRGGGCLSSMVG